MEGSDQFSVSNVSSKDSRKGQTIDELNRELHQKKDLLKDAQALIIFYQGELV